jgi:membrane protease YdiL (CAAX protease family)
MSPPLYWVGSWLAEIGVLPMVEGFPFHRYFSRSMQISALLMLWPAFRWVGIRRLGELGIQPNAGWRRDVTVGFLLAFLPLAALSAGYLWAGVCEWRSEWNGAGFLRIAGTAVAVSTIEEFLFRGVLLGLCLRAMGPFRAAVVSSAIFAGVHFLRGSREPMEGGVEWTSGFVQLTKIFAGAPEWPLIGWGACSLFAAGLLLAYGALRTKSLFLPAGLHAGWIFGQQGLQLMSKYQGKAPDFLLPWVGPNVVSGAVPTGLVPLAVLAGTAFIVWIYLRHARGRQGT